MEPTVITDALNPTDMVIALLVQFAPFILTVFAILIAFNLIKWGFSYVLKSFSFWGGSIEGTWSNLDYKRKDKIARDKGYADYDDYERNV